MVFHDGQALCGDRPEEGVGQVIVCLFRGGTRERLDEDHTVVRMGGFLMIETESVEWHAAGLTMSVVHWDLWRRDVILSGHLKIRTPEACHSIGRRGARKVLFAKSRASSSAFTEAQYLIPGYNPTSCHTSYSDLATERVISTSDDISLLMLDIQR